MDRLQRLAVGLVLLMAPVILAVPGEAHLPATPGLAPTGAVTFEPNRGQAPDDVLFVARTPNGIAHVLASGIRLGLEGEPLNIRFDNGHARSAVGEDATATLVHSLRGQDPDAWTHLRVFQSVLLEDVYSGIDVRLRDGGGRIEYDFIVAPGADPDEAVVRFGPNAALRLSAGSGDLQIHVAGGTVTQAAPVAYQEDANGQLALVDAAFKLLGSQRVGVQLGPHDPAKTLVIDPVVDFSSYLGGSIREDFYKGLAVDDDGYIYMVGGTRSSDFPTSQPLQPDHGSPESALDVFITKLTPDGSSVVYSTFLGGNDRDYAVDVDIDAAGNVYVVGKTASPDFPLVAPTQGAIGSLDWPDGFYAKLDASGAFLHYSSYLGGSDYDIVTGVAAESRGGMSIVGKTRSTDVATTARAMQRDMAGHTDALAARVTADGELRFLTYLGGNGYDYAQAVVLDKRGHMILVGPSGSPDFPVSQGAFQEELSQDGEVRQDSGFITRLHRSGRGILQSTFFGGTDTDFLRGVDLDARGNIYVVGDTNSTDLPVLGGPQQALAGSRDAFAARLTRNLQPVWSTYLGGSEADFGYDLAVGANGLVHIVGQTRSVDLPVVAAAQRQPAGLDEAFVGTLDTQSSRIRWLTYVGGSGIDEGKEVVLAPDGRLHVAGLTRSTDFPLVSALMDPYRDDARARNQGDAFLATFDLQREG